MAETIDFQKMRKDLIRIYEKFLENPEDKSIKKVAIDYDRNFGGLASYNDYLKSQPVSKNIEMALNWLSAIYQFGVWEKEHTLSDENIISKAKIVLENLKKSEQ
ncbi:MAG: hypothetical protein Q8N63_03830 [Nanoarchaeota archaeon]|nr:hypothetical protein [Nanoarchaeota archaeon]